MPITSRNIPPCAALAAALVILFSSGVQGAVITPELEAELAVRSPDEEVSVIVSFFDKVNYRQFEVKDRRQRNTRLFKAFKERAAATQGTLRNLLQNNRSRRIRELWVINGMAVTVPATMVRMLARLPGVESVRPDSILQAPVTNAGSPAPPEWNLSAVQAPDLWSLGYTGSGVVVANMDTGVDLNHPDLAGKWRGGSNSWYDPHGEHASPNDLDGHGTQTMGIMVGGANGGTAIGVAPDASWIAVKLYNDAGQATYSDIHLAFQWLLDPDGDPGTVDAPDVVNASWGLVGTAGQCITEFNHDIDVLKAAGTAFAFAAGNDGPAPLTSLSPANNPAGFSTGAVDASLAIANFSSRGQSACDGSIFPKTSAPGVNVNTSDLSFGGLPLYRVVSGTSFAAPHTAGVMALLAGAFPNASVSELESALTESALDLGVAGPDNGYGYGMIHAKAAYDTILPGLTPPTGSVLINEGAETTRLLSVVLTLNATGAAQMRFSWDSTTWSVWETYATTRNLTMPAGADGVRTLYVQYRNAAPALALSAVYSDTILLDRALPTGTVVINGGAATTAVRDVVLSLSATDTANAVTGMRLRWSTAQAWGAWVPYATTQNATLPGTNGAKTAYAQFRDAAGNISGQVADSIVLADVTPPTGSVLINGGAASTNVRAVTLSLSATDANTVTSMRLFKSSRLVWSAWTPYAPTATASIVGAAGTKTFLVQFRDGAGMVSKIYSDSIVFAP